MCVCVGGGGGGEKRVHLVCDHVRAHGYMVLGAFIPVRCNAQTHTHTMSLVFMFNHLFHLQRTSLWWYFTSPVTSIETRYEF